MNDQSSDRPDLETPFRYHLELSPAQLKITHTALQSMLDDFGHDEPEIVELIREVLAKLPDEHAIRAIDLDRELGREPGSEPDATGPPDDDAGGAPPAAA